VYLNEGTIESRDHNRMTSSVSDWVMSHISVMTSSIRK
jgi:hypothetical protein